MVILFNISKNLTNLFLKQGYYFHTTVISMKRNKQQNVNLLREIEELKTDLNNAKIERAAVLDIGENIEKQMQAKQLEYEKTVQR